MEKLTRKDIILHQADLFRLPKEEGIVQDVRKMSNRFVKTFEVLVLNEEKE